VTVEFTIRPGFADPFLQRLATQAAESLREPGSVSKKILQLLQPKVVHVKTPTTWPDGPVFTTALTNASAAMLGTLIPETIETPPIVPKDKAPIEMAMIQAEPKAVLVVTPPASEAVMALVDRAGIAAEQSLFAEASSLYQQALQAVPATERKLQAEILLNLGAAEVQLNKSASAIQFLRRAQESFAGVGDQIGVAEALHNIGFAHVRAGNAAEASLSLAEAQKAAGQATLRGVLTRRRQPPRRPSIRWTRRRP
jgi:tetratricopeptide (TPR) repeat protein